MKLVESGKIKPVIYEKRYEGLETVAMALGDLERHQVWGRAVLRICEDGEDEGVRKAKL